MLAGIIDPDLGAESLRARLTTLRGDGRHEFAVSGLAVIGDGLFAGDGERGLMLAGTIDNLAELATESGGLTADDPVAVLGSAHARHGEGTAARLRGDFALVAWDRTQGTTWIAQDQIAAGALFVSEQDGGVCFASEIHLLLALLRRRPSPDSDAVVRFLAGAAPVRRSTLYAGVRRLGAGRRLTVRGRRVEISAYHEFTYVPPFEDSHLDVAARLRDALARAVAVRIPAAGAVGITLSGGFDSSVVAAAAAAVVPGERLRGYSAVFPDVAGMDDRDLLDVLVHALGLTNIRYANEPGGMLQTAIAYTRRYALPLVGPGWVTELPLLRHAHDDGISVLLDGQGGDETFGATPYLVADLLRRGRMDLAVRLIRTEFQGAWRGVGARAAARMLAQYGARPLAPSGLRRIVRSRRQPARYAPTFLEDAPARTLVREEDGYAWARPGPEPVWWCDLHDQLTAVREDGGLGDYVRQRSEWLGVHGRPPLFDLDLTETTLRVPPQQRLDAHLDRPIGREAVAGLLPDAIRLSRRKSNLAPFYCRGLLGADRPLLDALLSSRSPEVGRWVRRDVLADLLTHPPDPLRPAAANQWTSTIWPLVSAELWLRAEHDPAALAALPAMPLRTRRL